MSTIRDLPGVRDISWQEGSDHITIITDTMVQSPGHTVCVLELLVCVWSQVVLYPLETCSTAGSCEGSVLGGPSVETALSPGGG